MRTENRLLPLAVVASLGLSLPVGCGGESANTNPDLNEVMEPTDPAEMDPVFEPECTSNADCTVEGLPFCDEAGSCRAPPAGAALGWGDGSPASVDLQKILSSAGNATQIRHATDMEFNPARPTELWVLHRNPHSREPCSESNATLRGCNALEGSVTIVFDAESDDRTTELRIDPNSWHFMRRPPALAFAPNGLFATCGEERTGNYLDSAADFIGPTLWTSDLSIFALPNVGINGTHLDMLHASPWCMGIAHEADNIYWVYNGNVGGVDRYNFNEDHGPGNANHDDGEVYRYAEGTLTRVEDVPSHMVYHEGMLYVADTGAGRIVKLDTNTGTRMGPITPRYETFADNAYFMDMGVTELVPPGTLEQPSGLELHDGLLYVTDHKTGKFHAFDLDGNHVRSLDTGLGEGVLAGFAFSPSGVIYFGDIRNSDIYRIVPR